jgi:hypothetical protein
MGCMPPSPCVGHPGLPDLATIDGTPMKYTHNTILSDKSTNWFAPCPVGLTVGLTPDAAGRKGAAQAELDSR